MPQPTNPADLSGNVDLGMAPGGDLSFDDLFATSGETSNLQTAPQVPVQSTEQTPPVAATPPTPPTDEVFLRTQSSVYKTREEAERGFSEKDASIARLRQFAIEKTGFDPLTNKSVQAPASPQAAPTPQDNSFITNPKRYWDELVDAAGKGDFQRYASTQAQYVNELQTQTLAPLVPLIQEVARQRAVNSLSADNKDFSGWVGSDDYTQFLETMPLLRNAISVAERDPRGFEQLPEFYKMAYLANQGRRLPDIVRAQQTNTAAAQPQTPTTTSSSTMTPPQPASYGTTREEMLRSREGRRDIIDQFERGGFADRDLNNFR